MQLAAPLGFFDPGKVCRLPSIWQVAKRKEERRSRTDTATPGAAPRMELTFVSRGWRPSFRFLSRWCAKFVCVCCLRPPQAPTRAKEAHRRPRHGPSYFDRIRAKVPLAAQGALHPGVPAPLPPLQTRYPPQASGLGSEFSLIESLILDPRAKEHRTICDVALGGFEYRRALGRITGAVAAIIPVRGCDRHATAAAGCPSASISMHVLQGLKLWKQCTLFGISAAELNRKWEKLKACQLTAAWPCPGPLVRWTRPGSLWVGSRKPPGTR